MIKPATEGVESSQMETLEKRFERLIEAKLARIFAVAGLSLGISILTAVYAVAKLDAAVGTNKDTIAAIREDMKTIEKRYDERFTVIEERRADFYQNQWPRVSQVEGATVENTKTIVEVKTALDTITGKLDRIVQTVAIIKGAVQ